MLIYAIKCSKCHDTIYSRARHDMRYCSCSSLAIDGGFDYNKVCFTVDVPYDNVKLELDITKKELYDDWSRQENRYGLIKNGEEIK